MRIVLAFLFALGACHAPPSPERDAGPSVCTAIGQSCTFAPGKLGTCVEVEPSAGPATFVCQSQH
ncbi:MAG TPA: hypothetical protein VGH28_14270 [Polyangiaceae bacterium]